MNRTKKLLALCLCSTVVATSFSTINVEAKTSAGAMVASGVLSDTVTTKFPMVKTQGIQAFAVSNDGFVYENNGENTIVITGYEGTASELIIPETIDGLTVTEIGESAFGGNDTLRTVTMASTITQIGDWAFDKCVNLTSVQLSSNLSSIGGGSFAGCTGLNEIVIPKTLNTYTGLLASPFDGCTNLKTVTIEEGATVICNSLLAGSGVETVNMPDTVTKIGDWAFDKCVNLTSVKLSSNLSSIGSGSFADCTGLTSITIPKTLKEFTGLLAGTFTGCTNLKTATIEEGATVIGENLFADSGIEVVNMPDTITQINTRAFYNCKNLTTVKLSSNLTGIGGGAFGKCTGLTSITIPKTLKNYTGITEGPFDGCENLKTATIEEGATVICENLFADSVIESVNMPDTITEIKTHAFYNCKNLTDVKLSSNLTGIGGGAFGKCTGLTSITIPKTLKNYVGITEGPFVGCENLKTATIEEGATVVCDNLFCDSSVETVNIPSTVIKVGENVFGECANLKEVYFSCNAPEIAKYAFSGVTATAYYPENNSTWTNKVRQNYDGTITWKTWKPAVTPVVSITNTTVTKVTTTTSKKKVTLSWKEKSDVTGYEIYKKTGNGKYKLVKTIKKAKTKKWTDKVVKSGKIYYYKIRAYKKVNKKITYSKFSSVKKVKVK